MGVGLWGSWETEGLDADLAKLRQSIRTWAGNQPPLCNSSSRSKNNKHDFKLSGCLHPLVLGKSWLSDSRDCLSTTYVDLTKFLWDLKSAFISVAHPHALVPVSHGNQAPWSLNFYSFASIESLRVSFFLISSPHLLPWPTCDCTPVSELVWRVSKLPQTSW